MLAMEKGGSDVIELGVPFTDPLADGKAIQEANNVCLSLLLSFNSLVEMLMFFVRHDSFWNLFG